MSLVLPLQERPGHAISRAFRLLPPPHRAQDKGSSAMAKIKVKNPVVEMDGDRERLRTARLYFVCDAQPGGEEPEPLLRAALAGGVDIVQLREKERAAPRDRAGGAHLPPPLRHLQRPLHRQRRPRAGPRLQRRRGPRRPGRHRRPPRRGSCSARRRSSASRPTPRSRSPPPPRRPSTTSASARSGRRRPKRAGPASASSWSPTPPSRRPIPSSRSAASTPSNAAEVVEAGAPPARRRAGDPRRRGADRGGRVAARRALGAIGEAAPGG